MIRCVVVSTPEVGNRSYLVHDGSVALVVDAQRDIDRVLDAAVHAKVRIVCVAETHIHNDYVSGGRALSTLLGVPYLVAAGEDVAFERRPVVDGDEIAVGPRFFVRVQATPGHTPHHVAYIALDAGKPVMVCSGGSLLFATTGRTDLFGAARTAELSHAQYQSVQRLGSLPPTVDVLPTHGFGSFCSGGGPTAIEHSTIGEEHARNLVFRVRGPAEFVPALIGQLTRYPSYYQHLGQYNRRGAAGFDPAPLPRLSGRALSSLQRDGAWLVDLRDRRAFAASHLAGSINAQHSTSFATYLGWVMPRGTLVALLAEHEETVRAAQRDLSRIGVEEICGTWTGRPSDVVHGPPLDHYPVVGAGELRAATGRPGTVVLDVRREDEWESGHLPMAAHLPLGDLLGGLADIPPGTVWVHCAAGYRAAIAASLLQRAGRRVVLVDGAVVGIQAVAA